MKNQIKNIVCNKRSGNLVKEIEKIKEENLQKYACEHAVVGFCRMCEEEYNYINVF